MIKHFKIIYEWGKSDFWLLNGLCISSGLLFHFFNFSEFLQGAVLIFLFAKCLLSLKHNAVLPAAVSDQDQFSWKYLQSLPLTKKQLLELLICSSTFNLLPAVVFFFSFQKIILVDVFLLEPFTISELIITAICLLLCLVISSIWSLRHMISNPRMQFVKKDKKNQMYATFRSFVVILAVIAYLVLFFRSIDDIQVMVFDFVKKFSLEDRKAFAAIVVGIFQNLKPFFSIWLLVPLCLLYAYYQFRVLLKIWMNEKVSYRSLERNYKRDGLWAIGIYVPLILLFSWVDNTPTMLSGSELLKAIHKRDHVWIEKLVADGADLNKANRFGYTPIMAAVHNADFQAYRFLLSKGAKLDGVTNKDNDKYHAGMNLLHLAVDGQSLKIIEDVLAQGFNVHELQGEEKISALQLASYICKPVIVEYFIKKGVNLNHVSKDGGTALHVAARKDCFQATVALTEAGIDPLVKDKAGKFAFDYSRKKSNSGVAFYLERKTRAPAGKN